MNRYRKQNNGEGVTICKATECLRWSFLVVSVHLDRPVAGLLVVAVAATSNHCPLNGSCRAAVPAWCSVWWRKESDKQTDASASFVRFGYSRLVTLGMTHVWTVSHPELDRPIQNRRESLDLSNMLSACRYFGVVQARNARSASKARYARSP